MNSILAKKANQKYTFAVCVSLENFEKVLTSYENSYL